MTGSREEFAKTLLATLFVTVVVDEGVVKIVGVGYHIFIDLDPDTYVCYSCLPKAIVMAITPWQQYQIDAAECFQRLGCEASVDTVIEGARASHRVDVLVSFRSFALPIYWIIECKRHRSRVKKEHVETLKSIALDTGVDRGILLSEVGFQKGAVEATAFTNIVLTSLDDLHRRTRPALLAFLLEQTAYEIARAKSKLSWYQTYEIIEQSDSHSCSSIGIREGTVDREMYDVLATELFPLDYHMDAARLGQFPFAIQNDGDVFVIDSVETYLRFTSRTLGRISEWLGNQKISKPTS